MGRDGEGKGGRKPRRNLCARFSGFIAGHLSDLHARGHFDSGRGGHSQFETDFLVLHIRPIVRDVSDCTTCYLFEFADDIHTVIVHL